VGMDDVPAVEVGEAHSAVFTVFTTVYSPIDSGPSS
jgi:hypothetical protein